ncbi:type II toxin-antitoxin system VapC family toxin [Corynebacterium variabile]|uniref:type II toxin-antitoxin system VapC family toxin n=1 Tax=Corynebacterium variabile TaxID=1727 RepID=UPI003F9067B9
MIVVDAGVLVSALLDDHADGDLARTRLRGEALHAPELIYPEVLSVIRRQVRSGKVDAQRAVLAVDDLAAVPLRVASHRSLIPRVWDLPDNLSSYDALYIALAETLDCPLLTIDTRMAHAPGIRCACELLTA